MVESTPDPGDGHCGIEVWLSEQRGRNLLWGWRFWQIWTLSKNPVSPDKHLSFIWHTDKICFILDDKIHDKLEDLKLFHSKKKKKSHAQCPRVVILGTTTSGATHIDLCVCFCKCGIACLYTRSVHINKYQNFTHHLICSRIWMWDSRIN